MSNDRKTTRINLANISRRRLLRGSLIGGAALTGFSSPVAGDDHDEEKTSYNSPEDAGTSDPVSPQQVDDASALLLKNCQPWDIPANEVILDELGIAYDIDTLENGLNAEALPLDQHYNMVIIASTQDQAFYDELIGPTREEILNFVSNGGTLVAHMVPDGYPCNGAWPEPFLPDGIRVAGEFLEDIEIVQNDHPVTVDLTDDDLSGWNASSHGYFENLNDNVNVIWGPAGQPTNAPVYIEYPYGDGFILATMQTMEWGVGQADQPLPLFNELTYAAEGEPGGPGGDSGIVLDNLVIDSLVDGEAAQGEEIRVSASATNPTEEPISDTIGFNFADQSLADIGVDLDPEQSTGVFVDLDVGTTVDPGSVLTGFEASGEAAANTVGTTSSTSSSTSETAAADKERVETTQTNLTIDNGEYRISIHPIASTALEFGGTNTLFEEFFALQSGDTVVPSFEATGLIQDYPENGEPGETYTATLDFDGVEVDRRVTLDAENAVFSLEHELRNNTGQTLPDFQFYQYFDWDIQGASGESALYNDADGNIYQIGSNNEIHSGFGSSEMPDEYDVGPYFDVGERVLQGDLANNEVFEDGDATAALKWNIGDFEDGDSFVVSKQVAAGFSRDAVADLLGGDIAGGGDSVSGELQIREKGDVNHSGTVGPADAVYTHQYVDGGEGQVAGRFNPAAADLNEDGAVDTADIDLLQNKIVGNDVDIPEVEPSVLDAGTE